MSYIEKPGRYNLHLISEGFETVPEINGKNVMRLRGYTETGETVKGTLWLTTDAEIEHAAKVMVACGRDDGKPRKVVGEGAGLDTQIDCIVSENRDGYCNIVAVIGQDDEEVRLAAPRGIDPAKSAKIKAALLGVDSTDAEGDDDNLPF